MGLIPSHAAELARSGLTPDTIARSGCYSVTGPGARDLLGWAAGPGLAFPYPGTNGAGAPYTRVKLDVAPPDGKRYRAPKGQPNHLYCPPTFDPAWRTDPATPLWITEGEKKCLKAIQEGLPCVAVPGVWSWKTKGPRDRTVPIPDLDAVTWTGRRVYLIFDSDGATNGSVRLAEFALAQELQRRGARVGAVHLPAAGPGKVGLDDYLLTHSVDTLAALPVVPILDPATDPGEAVLERLGNGHRVDWPLHGVTVELIDLREDKLDIYAHLRIVRRDVELHWSKINLAAPRSRAEVATKLGTVRGVPWAALLDRSCRLVVQADRAGNPGVIVIPRPQSGARYLVAPLAPVGVTTVLYGPGGSGKGYLAATLALGIAAGARLPPPLQVLRPGPVLYLDWESTEADFAERLWHLARGLGCTVGRTIIHRVMTNALTTEVSAVQALAHDHGVVAVFVDSLVPASGAEPEGAGAAQRVFNALRSLDPVTRIILAHVSKTTLASAEPGKPFGSIFIENLARSTWEIRAQKAAEGCELVQTLFHRKVNSGREQPPCAFRFHWDADPAEVVTVEATAVPTPDRPHSNARALLLEALARNSPQTTMELAQTTELPLNTVRGILNRFVTDFVTVGETRPGVPSLWARKLR